MLHVETGSTGNMVPELCPLFSKVRLKFLCFGDTLIGMIIHQISSYLLFEICAEESCIPSQENLWIVQ